MNWTVGFVFSCFYGWMKWTEKPRRRKKETLNRYLKFLCYFHIYIASVYSLFQCTSLHPFQVFYILNSSFDVGYFFFHFHLHSLILMFKMESVYRILMPIDCFFFLFVFLSLLLSSFRHFIRSNFFFLFAFKREKYNISRDIWWRMDCGIVLSVYQLIIHMK